MKRISDTGVEFIKQFEGCELKAYVCPAGILTIGYGCTTNVEEGMTITLEEADKLLRADLERFEDGVNQSIEIDITQAQFDALVSFSYNVGIGAFKSSTLLKVINSGGSLEEIGYQFSRWNKAGGKVLKGLTIRRQKEFDLYKGEC